MTADSKEQKNAVERMYGGTACSVQYVLMSEHFDGKTEREGVVHVFDLEGHAKASRAYAWSSPIEGSTKRRFFTGLHVPPVDSPQKAARAAIVAGQKRIPR